MDLDDAIRNMERPRRRPRWRRWLRRVAVTLLLAAAVGAGRYAWWRHGVHERLAEALAEMDAADPGWRLADIEKARAEVPEAENGARVVGTVARLLPRDWPSQQFVEALGTPLPPEQLSAEEEFLLSTELKAVSLARSAASELADLPRGRYAISYRKVADATPLADQQASRQITELLRYDAWHRAQIGDPGGALDSCRGVLNTGRSLGDEPLMISQLVRYGNVSRACQAAERVLAQGEPGDDALAKLQNLLREEDRFPSALVVARAARAAQHELCDGMESGEVLPDGAAGPFPGTPLGQLFGDLGRTWVQTEHAQALRTFTRLVEVDRLPTHQQEAGERAVEAELARLPDGRAVWSRLAFPAVRKVLGSTRRKHAEVRCAAVALALERYRREGKAWPESLDRLVPRFLAAVPLGPNDGAPLRYRRLGDGVVVYSVGPDRTDDGGKVRGESPTEPGTDVGFRLWDVARRRQPPAAEAKP